ncbi:hypothetical protein BDV96DRAFT_598678 [Lophiotrema nucula]|uniref:Uncharacterized protein n=1 Tax=Lophiotrema nucula TaxID=690887 RepID=A0A6A5ZCQ1_9PLEO|nr:hypothetical protein BDV96DRAFT_598678 [Lophiotrema nucula]
MASLSEVSSKSEQQTALLSPPPTKRETKGSHWSSLLSKPLAPLLAGWRAVFTCIQTSYRALASIFMKLCEVIGRAWKSGWNAEICGCVFAALSLMGLVMILRAHEAGPLPDWPQLVTINSIVSIFTLFIRAGIAMVLAEGISQSKWQWFRRPRTLTDMEKFDSASRGPFGSLVLLFGFRINRPYYIAAFGALLTVLISFTGFFAQQIVVFHDCLLPSTNAVASILKTNNYNATGKTGGFINNIYLPMAAAINVGIIQPQTNTTSLLSSCSTGNCIFASDGGAAFSTIAMSFSCTNLTAQIRTQQGKSDQDTTYYLDYLSDETNISLSLKRWGKIGLVTGASSIDQTKSTIGTITMLYETVQGEGLEVYNPQAAACSIFPVLNTYSAGISNALLTESTVSSTRIGCNVLQKNDARFILATNQTLRNGAWENCRWRSDPTVGYTQVAIENVDHMPSNASIPPGETEIRWYPDDCVWSFGVGAAYDTADYLIEILNDGALRYSGSDYSGSIHMKQLYQYGGINFDTINQFMRNMTDAMTATIRTHGSEGEDWYAKGTAMATTTCVGVQWAWISFPAATIVLTAFFLVFAKLENRDVPNERLWKSSFLAALFCTLDAEVVDKALPLQQGGMEEIAESTQNCKLSVPSILWVNLNARDLTISRVAKSLNDETRRPSFCRYHTERPCLPRTRASAANATPMKASNRFPTARAAKPVTTAPRLAKDMIGASTNRNIRCRLQKEGSVRGRETFEEVFRDGGLAGMAHLNAPLPGGHVMKLQILHYKEVDGAAFLRTRQSGQPKPTYNVFYAVPDPLFAQGGEDDFADADADRDGGIPVSDAGIEGTFITKDAANGAARALLDQWKTQFPGTVGTMITQEDGLLAGFLVGSDRVPQRILQARFDDGAKRRPDGTFGY